MRYTEDQLILFQNTVRKEKSYGSNNVSAFMEGVYVLINYQSWYQLYDLIGGLDDRDKMEKIREEILA